MNPSPRSRTKRVSWTSRAASANQRRRRLVCEGMLLASMPLAPAAVDGALGRCARQTFFVGPTCSRGIWGSLATGFAARGGPRSSALPRLDGGDRDRVDDVFDERAAREVVDR